MLTPARSHNQSQNNIAVLEKERQLGQDLLERAANGISGDILKKVADVSDEKHLHAIRTFLAMLQLAAEGECTTQISNEEIKQRLGKPQKLLHQIHNFKHLISALNADELAKLKAYFMDEAQTEPANDSKEITLLKEFLCESFCMFEIITEIEDARSKEGRPSLNAPSGFMSPGSLISPIPSSREREVDTSTQIIRETLATPQQLKKT